MGRRMNRTVRGVATSLAIGFGMYFAATAMVWNPRPDAPVLAVIAVAVYLAVLSTAILGAPVAVRMPLWTALLALLAAVAVPVMVNLAFPEDARTTTVVTWYIGGIGLLGIVLIVRRRFVLAWLLLVALAAVSQVFLGLPQALDSGLVGSTMWVLVAQLLVLFWDRAVRDTERLAEIQQAVSAWQATQLVRQRERRVRTQFALAVAGPVLSRTVASQGVLTDEERLEARLAEGRLRDELRGADLLNDAVRDAIAAARRRGASVTVFDEGGLDGIDEARRAQIRDELAGVVAGAHAGRLIIRSARDDRIAVTVVGRVGSGSSRDDDAVDVWHEIPRAAGTA